MPLLYCFDLKKHRKKPGQHIQHNIAPLQKESTSQYLWISYCDTLICQLKPRWMQDFLGGRYFRSIPKYISVCCKHRQLRYNHTHTAVLHKGISSTQSCLISTHCCEQRCRKYFELEQRSYNLEPWGHHMMLSKKFQWCKDVSKLQCCNFIFVYIFLIMQWIWINAIYTSLL